MNLKITLLIAVIILIMVFAGWYFYTQYAPSGGQTQQESAQDSDADNTAAIEAELNQIPDDTSVNGDMDSLDASLQAF